MDASSSKETSYRRNCGEGYKPQPLEVASLLKLVATNLLFPTADCGGSNSPRTRLWRLELQPLANEMGLQAEVCHVPPGTSKWNRIQHRLFCHITRNWQGVPLETLWTVVRLSDAPITREGLEVHGWLDDA